MSAVTREQTFRGSQHCTKRSRRSFHVGSFEEDRMGNYKNAEWLKPISVIWVVRPVPFAKRFLFFLHPNHRHIHCRLVPP
jgi:hypothetical protein